MALPIFQTDNRDLSLMQTRWASELNPVLKNPITNPSILTGLMLVAGNNIINHKLGTVPQGWFITDINAAATIYRSATSTNLTITLNSSAACTINLVVY